MNKQNPSTVSPTSKPSQQPAGTGSSGSTNETPAKANLDSAVSGGATPMEGPGVSGDKTDRVETKVLNPGHADDAKAGKVTEVKSHIEPTVPAPAAPNTALGIDPSHPTVDTYPSEAAASEAPGIHVDLTDVAKPVGVITHGQAPFHRVDGDTSGQTKTVTEAVKDAKHNAGSL